MFVVQRLEPHFPQASKTSIGHVVQLLYRASCFKVTILSTKLWNFLNYTYENSVEYLKPDMTKCIFLLNEYVLTGT